MFLGLGMIANFLVAVVVITVFLAKDLSGDSQLSSTTSTAMDVLNEPYTEGEIDTAEWRMENGNSEIGN